MTYSAQYGRSGTEQQEQFTPGGGHVRKESSILSSFSEHKPDCLFCKFIYGCLSK